METMNAVGSMLVVLALAAFGAGPVSSAPSGGAGRVPAGDDVDLGPSLADYRFEHAIWRRSSWVAPEQVPRNAKRWM
jgi:hypothetical protein